MAAPQLSPARANEFYTHRLPNGLQLLGQRMPDLESVSLCFFARTGARDEDDPALFGVSHFLEHMVFKGTARRDTEQITLDFNLMGAEFNAFTSVEQTVFYAHILNEYLPNAVDLLSDMMRPRLDAEDFSMERNVILEEIARAEDAPSGQAYRRLMQTYFANTPLGHDVLGTKESIREMSVEQMRAYHARRYGANNLIFSIAGAFEWERVVGLVEQACGAWSEGEMGRVAPEYKPDAPRHNVVVKPQLKQQLTLIASPSVSAQDDDLYAAELAAMIVGDGAGSRLYWNIYQKGLADSAGSSLSAFDHSGMLMTFLSATPEHTPAVLELAQAELKGLQADGVQEQELRRAKDKLISATVLDGDSAYGRMRDLAYTWVTEGRLRSIQDEMDRIEAVTLTDIRRVLDRYPTTENQTLVGYGPMDASAIGFGE
ncbi:MAG TPA: pitrilysin family protein [Ktedonobacterales bacterium]